MSGEATETQWAALDRYVHERARDLNLHAWQITVERDPPQSHTDDDKGGAVDETLIDAQTWVTRDGMTAKIRFAESWHEQKPEAVRTVVMHELLHVPTDPLFSDMIDQIEGFASKQAAASIVQQMVRQYERMVDMLAIAIAPNYPLPDWPVESNDGAEADGRT